jgi:hypothetical protein
MSIEDSIEDFNAINDGLDAAAAAAVAGDMEAADAAYTASRARFNKMLTDMGMMGPGA